MINGLSKVLIKFTQITIIIVIALKRYVLFFVQPGTHGIGMIIVV